MQGGTALTGALVMSESGVVESIPTIFVYNIISLVTFVSGMSCV